MTKNTGPIQLNATLAIINYAYDGSRYGGIHGKKCIQVK
jgi:hypothetical protein